MPEAASLMALPRWSLSLLRSGCQLRPSGLVNVILLVGEGEILTHQKSYRVFADDIDDLGNHIHLLLLSQCRQSNGRYCWRGKNPA